MSAPKHPTINNTEPEPYLTYDEAEAATGVPGWKLRKWVWADRLPAHKPDGERGRTWLLESDIRAFMASSRSRLTPH